MHVLGLWFYDLFTNISVIYIYWNLEYLLFIFSIIYNLKRHRKIFLLIWLLLSFVITQTETPPKASPFQIFECIVGTNLKINLKTWHARNLTWDAKKYMKLFFDKKFFFKVRVLLFGGARLHNMKQWWTAGEISFNIRLLLIIRKWFKLFFWQYLWDLQLAS